MYQNNNKDNFLLMPKILLRLYRNRSNKQSEIYFPYAEYELKYTCHQHTMTRTFTFLCCYWAYISTTFPSYNTQPICVKEIRIAFANFYIYSFQMYAGFLSTSSYIFICERYIQDVFIKIHAHYLHRNSQKQYGGQRD